MANGEAALLSSRAWRNGEGKVLDEDKEWALTAVVPPSFSCGAPVSCCPTPSLVVHLCLAAPVLLPSRRRVLYPPPIFPLFRPPVLQTPPRLTPSCGHHSSQPTSRFITDVMNGFQCRFCARVFSTSLGRIRHMKAAHNRFGSRQQQGGANDSAPIALNSPWRFGALGHRLRQGVQLPLAGMPSPLSGPSPRAGTPSATDGTQTPHAGTLQPPEGAPVMQPLPASMPPSQPSLAGTQPPPAGAPPLPDEPSLWLGDMQIDGMERGTLAADDAAAADLGRGSAMSISARIQAYYDGLPEAGRSALCVHPSFADTPTLFDVPQLAAVLRFAVTAGGAGLSQASALMFATVVMGLEAAVAVPGGPPGLMARRFPTPSAFTSALMAEHNRVLALRQWRHVNIVVGGTSYPLYFRDILQAGLDTLQEADTLVLEGCALAPTPDGARRRSNTFDSDAFLAEQADVRRIHGSAAYVMGTHLHSDEAVVAWNGNQLLYAVRAKFINAQDDGGKWVTVGYIPHIAKVVGNGKNARTRLAVSDGRHDLLQRCYAVMLRSFAHASEHGVHLDLTTAGRVFLVPRVLALIVDQVEERSLLSLMGHQCHFNCSHCMTLNAWACSPAGGTARPRPVVSSLESQMAAAVARVADGRPRTRVTLGKAISALPFAPALGGVHGLGTGLHSLYNIVSFDVLHVWKQGVLRTITQRVPALLAVLCPDSRAVMGSVQETLDAVKQRGFELGRLCRASPSSPGYVFRAFICCHAGRVAHL